MRWVVAVREAKVAPAREAVLALAQVLQQEAVEAEGAVPKQRPQEDRQVAQPVKTERVESPQRQVRVALEVPVVALVLAVVRVRAGPLIVRGLVAPTSPWSQ